MGLPPHFIQDPLGNKKLALKTQLPLGMLRTGGGIVGEIDPRNAINLVKNPISFGSDVSDWFPCTLSPFVTITSVSGLVDELGDTINLLTEPQIFENDDYILYETTGTIIGGLGTGNNYWVINATATSFQLSLTKGGAAINLTSDGTGDQTFRRISAKYNFLRKGTSDTTGLTITHEKQSTTTLSYSTSSAQTVLLQVGDPLTYQAALILTPAASAYTNKIKLKLNNGGTPWTSGKFIIEVRSVSSGNPTLEVLATTGELDVTNNNHLPYGTQPLVEYTLSNYVSFQSGVPIAIVVRPLSVLAGSSSTIRTTSDLGGGDANSSAKFSTSGGLSWSSQTYDWHYEIVGDNISGTNDMLSTVGQIKLAKSGISHTNAAWVMNLGRIPRAWMGKQLIFEFDFYNPNLEVPYIMFYDIDTGDALTIYGMTAKESVVNNGGHVGLPLRKQSTDTHRCSVMLGTNTRSVAAVIVYPGNTFAALNFYISNMSFSPSGNALITDMVPIGTIVTSISSTTPDDFLYCDGSAVSRTTYRDLFAVIGTTHGQGDGSTTFNIPDYRGRFLRGQDSGAGRDPDAGSRTAMNTSGNTGDNVGSVQGMQYQSHTHPVQEARHNAPAGAANPGARIGGAQYTNDGPSETAWSGSNASGGNETRPINANVRYYIKYRNRNNVVSTSEMIFKNAGAKLQKSGTQAFSSETKVTGWTVEQDTGGLWDSTNNRMVAQSTGWHIIQLQFHATPTTTTQMMAAYKINGGATKYVGEFPYPASASDRNGGWALEYLNKNDYVEAYLNTNAAVTVQAGAGTAFGIVNIADLTVIGNSGPFEVLSANSSSKTPAASGHWHNHTGNALVLPPGVWELMPSLAFFNFSGGSPTYSFVQAGWFGANGADSAVVPAALSTVTGLTVLSGTPSEVLLDPAPANNINTNSPSIIVKATTTCTVYLNTYAAMTTAANARIGVRPQARRIQ